MANPNFRISTPRLYLHYFQPSLDSHCDFLVTLFNAPEVLKANGGVVSPVPNRESERKGIEDRVERQSQTGYGRYTVSLRPPTSEEVDDCSILHTEASYIPDIGFSLLRPFWGKGYATEAAQALLDYFENVKQLKEALGFYNLENE
ncbi:acyl-CoA N-acyltransferase, partial [Phaeosphaeriaceae sp. PMI808]